ncbi:MAG: hypothetical protein ACKV19_12700 [Verrucomicrobiales bacterium]
MRRSPFKRWLQLAGLGVVAVGLVMGEAWLRGMQREEMVIGGLPVEGARITGVYHPDFLWAGRAWEIRVETADPLVLTLDQWTGRIPAGNHTIFSNHDYTNTGRFGERDFWGMAKTVVVRKVPP